jgi:hypothetical protein
MSSPHKVVLGQRGKVTLVTASHGALRAGLVKSYEPAPEISQKSIGEVDTVGAVKVINVDNGVAGKIGYAESNQKLIDAAMMDQENSLTGIELDHTNMRSFTLMVRHFPDQDDTVFGGKLILGCLAAPPGIPVIADDISMRDMPFRALRIKEIKGYDIRHVRVRTTPAAGPLSTPAAPTLVEGAAGNFTTGDMVYVRVAMVNAVLTSAPISTTPISRASDEVVEAIGAVTRKVTVTLAAPVPAGQTAAVYVGRFSGGESFYGLIAAAGSTLDVTDYPNPQNSTPPRNNSTAAYQHPDDLVFVGSSVDLTQMGGKPAQAIIPSGLRYMAVLKNGIITPFSGDESSGFGFTSDGVSFFLGTAPTDQDWWDLFFPVTP